ncbi:MAG TPA: ABC transporter permease [Firmicutes bacterium]|nr:ABC transporter permease [Bacillota bacterium]
MTIQPKAPTPLAPPARLVPGAASAVFREAGTSRAISFGITILLVLMLWHGASALLNSNVLPSPVRVISMLAMLYPVLAVHAAVSAWRVLAGLALALVTAMPAGIMIGRNPHLDRALGPATYMLFPIPKVAFLPVIMILLGLGDSPKIVLIAVIVFFQILVAIRDATRNLEPELIYSVRSLGASPRQLYPYAVLPAVLPEAFTSMRVALGSALTTLFFTETFATFKGLGHFIMDAWSRAAYDEMFAGIATLSALGLGLFVMADVLEKHFCRWKQTA